MPDIYTAGKRDILPEARRALALGKLSQTLLPVSPTLPCCHFIWLPYWADFFLRIWCYFCKMCFITNFKFERIRKKHRGATCFCQQLGSISQVWTTSTRVFACSSSFWLCQDDLFTRQGHLTQVLTAWWSDKQGKAIIGWWEIGFDKPL